MIMATTAAGPGSIRRILSAESMNGESCRNACNTGNVGEPVSGENVAYICNQATQKFGKNYFGCLNELNSALAEANGDDQHALNTFCDYICPYFD